MTYSKPEVIVLGDSACLIQAGKDETVDAGSLTDDGIAAVEFDN